ncbi:MAG TPA: hypothetical protein VL200_14365 [Lacunisphaera sp.]|jgi:hypothetical protein|nr:hypothetical protein [Lacunisphaera sp.]
MRCPSTPGLAFLLLAAFGAVEARADLPARKLFQFGEYTITASAGDEPYVEALALQLADFKPRAGPAPAPAKLDLATLARRREYFLGRIAGYLALAKPTDAMEKSFDAFLKVWGLLTQVGPPPIPRHFALWRSEELRARLDAGEKIDGFSKDASGQMTFAFNFAVSSSAPEEIGKAWDHFVCPLKIGASPGQTPREELAGRLKDVVEGYIGSYRTQLAGIERQEVFNVLHEATESGIVWHYLGSRDRRWFCDGVANYVAFRVIAAEVGEPEARTYYDLSAELTKYAGEAPRIDLAAWPAAEAQAGYAEDLNQANYAFATQVIAGICRRYGDDLLPRLFAEIGRTKREKATINTVIKAYKKLTHEDLRSYLPKAAGQTAKSGGGQPLR